ncbi:hypothetical protein DV451_003514 [Geotrichum candidum]|uniref:EF-hand domain-containing protein n=2 Tax=Geotrichum candidum TaxID=1173061 RepID=A0A9P5G300_GEOCN|nr:hypothetical protein DV451_003514 [Geotrichum candidum]KAF5107726.1 hypothetical protein DV453_002879 [Geotrichum candidum]KAF5115275.1 hypothetical protein DV454_002425 [Geotrichum candidum]KAF5119378.1 hypothetical protein DV452_001735 [Geotrichum candidum]KAF5135718.1 hypothetical protein DV495_000466 [Geotrichum candidum]
MLGTNTQREQRIERLFRTLDTTNTGKVDADSLIESFRQQYNPLPKAELGVDHIISNIAKTNSDFVSFEDFKSFMTMTESHIALSFNSLDTKQDGVLDIDEVYNGLANLGLDLDHDRVQMFFNIIDLDGDGLISYEEWSKFLHFVPNEDNVPLLAAYEFFIEEIDLSSEGDFFLSSETLNGLGYFLAGGFAGVISRTCTAPFDRLKVYLIAQSGQPLKKAAQSSASSSLSASIASSASSASKSAPSPIIRAVKHIWSQGGIRSFFVGNGLNVIKVFPESAMKFGSFETAKRFLAQLEGKSDTSEISRASTFLAGGIGGVVAQFTVYPIDTLKFRIQCESLSTPYKGNDLVFRTIKQMWNEAGIKMFYRGLGVGVLGIFPFAAFDLGTFSAMKRAYVKHQAKIQNIDEADVRLGNLLVLSMGASSGCVGASLVYPINLLRTRLQAQGTHAHPYRYNGFMDVYYKTVARDGYRGLWRGLAPNLAKVAPAVSISYLIYENSKTFLGLA